MAGGKSDGIRLTPYATRSDPAAFDAVAADYDTQFTHSILGRWLRPRVWARLATYFTAGQHVLELSCGTGEDAVWLAGRGVRVTATDGSAAMIAVTEAKVQAAGLEALVDAQQVSLQEVIGGYFTHENPRLSASSASRSLFDGAFSNFGGLNTIPEWRPLAQALAAVVRPGGYLVLVPMGPVCPWEMAWYGLHGRLRTAFRRLSKQAIATIGGTTIPVSYPAAGRLRRDFAPWFRHCHTESLGFWLPPTYLEHLVQRWPGLFGRLNRLDRAAAGFLRGWGDHYLTVFERQ